MLRQRKQHPRLEGRVRSPLGAASRTEVREGTPGWREKGTSVPCGGGGAGQVGPQGRDRPLWAAGEGPGEVALGRLSWGSWEGSGG